MARKNELSRLAGLGVYGFDAVEPLILAALVTGDPLLLIGPSGTGKTFLLNTLSEALGLEHRHYNASLISFDDLVGFPFPDKDGPGVRFLETPATVWGAESVLIDEISRCKPEHQNRLFSLVCERRIQGIPLPRLRYRWAAMNPCSSDQGGSGDYSGSEALDPALADRFALFIEASDWAGLTEAEHLFVADPAGEGRIADDGGALRRDVEGWTRAFDAGVGDCPSDILRYVTTAISALNSAGIRISPRRARFMTRSLFASVIVTGHFSERQCKLLLRASLPHACWGETPSREAVAAAHRLAWDVVRDSDRRWLPAFLAEGSLPRKLEILLDNCQSPDEGTQAVAELLAMSPPDRAAAFAFAVYPAAASGKLPVGAEGVNDLGKRASPFLSASGLISWAERLAEKDTDHPDLVRYAAALAGLTGGRAERAKQFFNGCLVRKCKVADPASLESEIQQCVEVLKRRGLV
ncbi:MAG: MoxR family ATPase [Acidobacteria bacterium]|nr:MoxR family ATPase [Acidobacteriota bacterium]